MNHPDRPEVAQAAQAAAPDLIDPQVLLAACGNDRAVLDAIAGALRINLPDYVAAVARALDGHDWPQLREAAHRLRGLVSPFSVATRSQRWLSSSSASRRSPRCSYAR